jgi:hypothetical protein
LKYFCLVLALAILSGCFTAPSQSAIETTIAQTQLSIPPSTYTIEPTTPPETPTITLKPTLTATLIPTFTPTPTSTKVPTTTSTPIGGGSGLVQIYSCKDSNFYSIYNNCTLSVLSLSDMQIETMERPEFRDIEEKEYKHRLELYDPSSGESKIILECPQEYQECNQQIIFGSPYDEWIYIIQGSQLKFYDGKHMTDLYRVNTRTGESSAVDHFERYIFDFHPFPGSTKGLLSVFGGEMDDELMIYDMETQERHSVAKSPGQFYRFGFSPDLSTFWYRTPDYCDTELVSKDGKRIAKMKNSDGILGWLDQEKFLLFTANNNPPICSPNSIAIANRYGLTGDWITHAHVDTYGAQISPDGTKLVFASDCNYDGCRKVMITNSDGSAPYLLMDSPDYTLWFFGKFSPDGKKLFYVQDNKLMMVNIDGSDPQFLFEPKEGFITEFSF